MFISSSSQPKIPTIYTHSFLVFHYFYYILYNYLLYSSFLLSTLPTTLQVIFFSFIKLNRFCVFVAFVLYIIWFLSTSFYRYAEILSFSFCSYHLLHNLKFPLYIHTIFWCLIISTTYFTIICYIFPFSSLPFLHQFEQILCICCLLLYIIWFLSTSFIDRLEFYVWSHF